MKKKSKIIREVCPETLDAIYRIAKSRGAIDMLSPAKKRNKKTKEEVLWNYLLKRCDTSYEARLMYNAIVRTMKSERPTEIFCQ